MSGAGDGGRRPDDERASSAASGASSSRPAWQSAPAGDEEEEERSTRQKRRVPVSKCCLGALYFSSARRAQGDGPRCVGVHLNAQGEARGRVLRPKDPQAADGPGKEGGFKYACIGYSVHRGKGHAAKLAGGAVELPLCQGMEVIALSSQEDSPQPIERRPLATRDEEEAPQQPPPRPPPRRAIRPPPRDDEDDRQSEPGFYGEFFDRFSMNCYVLGAKCVENAGIIGGAVLRTASEMGFGRDRGDDDRGKGR